MAQSLGGGRDLDHLPGNGPGSGGPGGGGSMIMGLDQQVTEENRKVLEWIAQVLNASTREAALLELSKKREQVPDLALILWHSFGEIEHEQSLDGWEVLMDNRCYDLSASRDYLGLSAVESFTTHSSGFESSLQCPCVAAVCCFTSRDPWTVSRRYATLSFILTPQLKLIKDTAHIPLFLYPFLNTTSKSRPFEYLRLTSLGVIGALVKNDSTDVINFLLTTEIIPLCLRIMETGSELSKTVAIFIVQKILLDDMGLQYICQTYERFYAVGTVLSNMVTQLVDQQTVRLLKHVVRCFLRYVVIGPTLILPF